MNGLVFKMFGVLFLAFYALSLLVTANEIRVGRLLLTPEVFACNCIATAVVLFVCIGLLRLRKWAAILFSAATASAGLWLIIGSILYVPFPWMLPNLGMGICLLLPTTATYLLWQDLVWKV
jgi:hypothetical protein